jgi:hypothetical protein
MSENNLEPTVTMDDAVADTEPLKTSYMTINIVMLSIAIAVPVVSWVYIPFGGDSHWFSRSGTIMAIIGIMLESRLFIGKLIAAEMTRISGKASYRMVMNKAIAMLSHITLICGAVISGYGDLIFRHFKLGGL